MSKTAQLEELEQQITELRLQRNKLEEEIAAAKLSKIKESEGKISLDFRIHVTEKLISTEPFVSHDTKVEYLGVSFNGGLKLSKQEIKQLVEDLECDFDYYHQIPFTQKALKHQQKCEAALYED